MSSNEDRKNDIILQFETYEELLKYFNQFNAEQEIGWRKRGGVINGRLKDDKLVQFIRNKKYICWRGQKKTRKRNQTMIKFEFDGSPFLIAGREQFMCHQGPNVDRNWNILNKLTYTMRTGKIRKNRQHNRASKKKNCLAKAEILYVLKLFNLKTRLPFYDRRCTHRMGEIYRRIHRKAQTEEELNRVLGISHIFLLRITHPTMHTCRYISGIGISEPHNAIGPMVCIAVSNETQTMQKETPTSKTHEIEHNSNVSTSNTNIQLECLTQPSKRRVVDPLEETENIKKQKLASTIVQINIDSCNEIFEQEQEIQHLNSVSDDHDSVDVLSNDVNSAESEDAEMPCHAVAESSLQHPDYISEFEEDATDIISIRENPPEHDVKHEDPISVRNEMVLSAPARYHDIYEIQECKIEDVEISCDKAGWPNAPDNEVRNEDIEHNGNDESTSRDCSTSKTNSLINNINFKQKKKSAIKICESLKDILLETESEDVLDLFQSSAQNILKLMHPSSHN